MAKSFKIIINDEVTKYIIWVPHLWFPYIHFRCILGVTHVLLVLSILMWCFLEAGVKNGGVVCYMTADQPL
jgi:hypothetical protein